MVITILSARSLVPFLLAFTAASILAAAEGGDPRAIVVEDMRNDSAKFVVRVDVDHMNRTYEVGEYMRVTVRSSYSGYLYLLYCSADKNVVCLFPNHVQSENKIRSNANVVVPAPSARFRLRIAEPTGEEVLKAIVTNKPIKALDAIGLAKSPATPLEMSHVRAVRVEIDDRKLDWAEHYVRITTFSNGRALRARAPKRIGVFVGIANYRSRNIPRLSLPQKDAETVAEVMVKYCQLDKAITLTNEEATLRNIEHTIRKRVADLTRPGDTVIIYWSGHGARCADDNGDEADGYDELLVPYDGVTDNIASIRRTMLLDDKFGRWIQELDGRKILVVLDTCHSGGQATHAKGLKLPGQDGVKRIDFDFFDGEMQRAKDIGQKETAILASSQPSQLSFERREGDLSTMTYFFVKRIKQGSGRLTLKEMYDSLKKEVPEYVEKRFHGEKQLPVLFKNTSSPLSIRLR